MKKPPKAAGIIVGAFVVLLMIIGSVTGCGNAKPAVKASPAATATATATPTPTVAPTRTLAAAAKVKAQPKRTQAAPAISRAAAPAPPPPPPPHTTAPAAAPAPPAPRAPAGCHPLSNKGTCYEPGEYCRNVDHGASGVAGDGEAITCADNNGWRWEPS